MEFDEHRHAEHFIGRYTEIMPGRPTISEHRCPYDGIFPYIDAKKDALETKLCVNIITAAEQQTTATSEISTNMQNIKESAEELTTQVDTAKSEVSSSLGKLDSLMDMMARLRV